MLDVRIFAIVRDERGRMLCVRRAHEPRDWTLPGGKMDKGESPFDALEREVKEESGCVVRATSLIGIYSTPEENDLALLLHADLLSRETWKPDREIAAAAFHEVEALPEPFSEHARIRIRDALSDERGVLRVLAKKSPS
jgi:ADP-ribose pyrophosphatase YjhB (NUDIX family)